jgi:hypothetical protein
VTSQCLVELGSGLSKFSLPSSCCNCFLSSGFEPVNLSSNFMRQTLVGLTQGGARVDEDKLGHIDEVGDIEPGKTKKGTFTLTAGKYLLFCNEEGHMNAGMVTSFVVEP